MKLHIILADEEGAQYLWKDNERREYQQMARNLTSQYACSVTVLGEINQVIYFETEVPGPPKKKKRT